VGGLRLKRRKKKIYCRTFPMGWVDLKKKERKKEQDRGLFFVRAEMKYPLILQMQYAHVACNFHTISRSITWICLYCSSFSPRGFPPWSLPIISA